MICPVDGCNARYDGTTYVMCRSCWRRVPADDAWRSRLRFGDQRSVDAHEAVKLEAIKLVSRKRAAARAQQRLDV